MNQYSLLKVIGEGTYGVVFKCKSKESDEIVAIKKFKEPEDAVTMREIKLLQRIQNDNIVSIKNVFKENNRLHVVFEYVDQDVLALLQKHKGGVPGNVVQKLMYQLVLALDCCHSQRILHRDVKPENLLVSASNTLKLCDFGCARKLPTNSMAALTEYVSTRWYRAPELIIGAVYGPGVDIWAMGCILPELLTSMPLFPGSDAFDQLFRIQRAQGPLPPQLAAQAAHSHFRVIAKRIAKSSQAAQNGPYSLNRTLSKKISSVELDFVKKCLEMDPAKRITAKQAMEHKYFDSIRKDFQYEVRIRQNSLSRPMGSNNPHSQVVVTPTPRTPLTPRTLALNNKQKQQQQQNVKKFQPSALNQHIETADEVDSDFAELSDEEDTIGGNDNNKSQQFQQQHQQPAFQQQQQSNNNNNQNNNNSNNNGNKLPQKTSPYKLSGSYGDTVSAKPNLNKTNDNNNDANKRSNDNSNKNPIPTTVITSNIPEDTLESSFEDDFEEATPTHQKAASPLKVSPKKSNRSHNSNTTTVANLLSGRTSNASHSLSRNDNKNRKKDDEDRKKRKRRKDKSEKRHKKLDRVIRPQEFSDTMNALPQLPGVNPGAAPSKGRISARQRVRRNSKNSSKNSGLRALGGRNDPISRAESSMDELSTSLRERRNHRPIAVAVQNNNTLSPPHALKSYHSPTKPTFPISTSKNLPIIGSGIVQSPLPQPDRRRRSIDKRSNYHHSSTLNTTTTSTSKIRARNMPGGSRNVHHGSRNSKPTKRTRQELQPLSHKPSRSTKSSLSHSHTHPHKARAVPKKPGLKRLPSLKDNSSTQKVRKSSLLGRNGGTRRTTDPLKNSKLPSHLRKQLSSIYGMK
eukprot:TRINITY_DN3642_c0_g1_i1.p1 TRINITY_DN3642_c0_g1~~TRINITY_DN3642_c0_g1_i1.p1  ORF type:complete len:854 (+),score=241.71 TRINITY_DN3642_c0_g1_i1:82-2643(+)